jgi:hypothetical protein
MREALFPLVPDGPRLLTEMIAPVHDQQRAFVAPRLQVTHDGFLRAAARTGLAATPRTNAERSRSVSTVVLIALVALIGLAGAAFVVLGQRQASAERPASSSLAPAAPAKLESVSFELVVRPADARVTVDGNPTTIIDGKLAVHGMVGSTHVVRISAGGRDHETLVAIASSGLVPSTIDVGAVSPGVAPKVEAGVAESAKKGARAPRAAAPSAPRAAASSTPKRATGLAEGTDEF